MRRTWTIVALLAGCGHAVPEPAQTHGPAPEPDMAVIAAKASIGAVRKVLGDRALEGRTVPAE